MSDNTLRPLGDGRVSPTRPAVTGSTAQAAPPARQQLRQATDRLYTGGSFTAPVGQPALGGGLPSSWLQDLARLQDLQLPKEDRQRLQMRIKGALLDSAHPAFAQQLAQAMSDQIHDSPHSSDPLQGILKRAAEENPALKEAWLNSPLTKGRRDYLAQNFARLGDNDPKVRAEAVKNLADVRLMPPGARQSAYEVAADQIAATTSDNPTGNATMDWLKDQKNVAAQQATIRGRTGQAVTDLNHHESATRRRGQKFLGDLLESDVPEVRRRAADALVESARGQNGSYSKQFLSERNTPETTEALSTLIGSKMDWTLRGTLQKRGAAGAEALSRRYSQARMPRAGRLWRPTSRISRASARP